MQIWPLVAVRICSMAVGAIPEEQLPSTLNHVLVSSGGQLCRVIPLAFGYRSTTRSASMPRNDDSPDAGEKQADEEDDVSTVQEVPIHDPVQPSAASTTARL